MSSAGKKLIGGFDNLSSFNSASFVFLLRLLEGYSFAFSPVDRSSPHAFTLHHCIFSASANAACQELSASKIFLLVVASPKYGFRQILLAVSNFKVTYRLVPIISISTIGCVLCLSKFFMLLSKQDREPLVIVIRSP
jgi:hypothetical protein